MEYDKKAKLARAKRSAQSKKYKKEKEAKLKKYNIKVAKEMIDKLERDIQKMVYKKKVSYLKKSNGKDKVFYKYVYYHPNRISDTDHSNTDSYYNNYHELGRECTDRKNHTSIYSSYESAKTALDKIYVSISKQNEIIRENSQK